MENFLTVAHQVAILFVLIGVGALTRRTRLISNRAIKGLVGLLVLVVTPCLIVDVFQRPFDPAMLQGLFVAFLVAVFGHLMVIALAHFAVRHPDQDVVRPLRLAAVFSNAGFMGIPLEQAILGDKGVFYGIIYVAVFNLFIWSWGVRGMEKGKGKSEKGKGKSEKGKRERLKLLVNPGTIGLAVGLPLFFFSTKLPDVLAAPIHELSNLNTPLAMIVVGHCLAGAKLGRVVRMLTVYVAMTIRLVVYPLLVIAFLYPFRHHLDRNMMLAMTIAASAPVAAMVSMFAAQFKRDVDVAVAVVSGSTFLSIITMPIVIALAMSLL